MRLASLVSFAILLAPTLARAEGPDGSTASPEVKIDVRAFEVVKRDSGPVNYYTVVADPAAEMLKRAVRLLAETKGEAWVNKGSVWHMIKRLDATFDPKDHGHANFAEMVKAMETIVETKKGETDHVLRVR